jgi:hypothetical protein
MEIGQNETEIENENHAIKVGTLYLGKTKY